MVIGGGGGDGDGDGPGTTKKKLISTRLSQGQTRSGPRINMFPKKVFSSNIKK